MLVGGVAALLGEGNIVNLLLVVLLGNIAYAWERRMVPRIRRAREVIVMIAWIGIWTILEAASISL